MAHGGRNSDRRKSVVKSAAAFRTISEVGRELDIPQHVLRFWESKFSQIKPLKRGGGRRYYRPEDIALLRRIRDLLYTDGYTIRGVQRQFRESGVKAVLRKDLLIELRTREILYSMGLFSVLVTLIFTFAFYAFRLAKVNTTGKLTDH